MRLSPVGAGFYSANRTVFRSAETKPQKASSPSLTEEAKKDPKAVMEKLLVGNGYGKLAAFDFYKAEITVSHGATGSITQYSIESLDTKKRDDIAGAIFEIALNSDLPKADKLRLLQTVVGEDKVFKGSKLNAAPVDDCSECNVSVKQMLNLHGYFKEKGKDLDKLAKALGAAEELSPRKDFNPGYNMTLGKVTYC